MTVRTNRTKQAFLGLALLASVACTTQYRNHGYVPNDEDLANIVVGVDTRDTVAESVGTPTTSGVTNDGGYYYVRTRVRHYGARQPKVIDRRLVAITFDTGGTVRNIAEYSLEDGQAVPIARRVTDNGIEDQSVLAQVLGNIGNFTPGTLGGG
ncbi:outer membrane protein assembly factor BamE [Shimia thalassica]|jgi:outer membrane protein assembly factor BamE (lipoprotein component of BamABCDE complex)|uniref:SmpA / OmlA family protein n=1 Tax=Shimia thalassica TaxID=1715693 RepID=A0A0P1IIN0_9RHOB|nr:outer membrane protein assembly factor BamE [Shimia thalassica]PHO02550.1 outer membrane protein assembly factor BamE [Rhodobacteraceae bacterium 4F10]MBU2944236.1 outer membrane protein assembly factor BamE [Shimia thalassica]MDO6479908.1 outer membrane protein assembly factor BamE [Shimia thalassica]MDO6483167.1 outer membrane protein assembly factor BamE [Shimia thalassica]MDO6503749.1 outer membrane protein assembly factor BamE [Shimia thalassica]